MGYTVADRGLSEGRDLGSVVDWQGGREKPVSVHYREVYRVWDGEKLAIC